MAGIAPGAVAVIQLRNVLSWPARVYLAKNDDKLHFTHPIYNDKIMRPFLPKRRLTANSAGIGTGPCTIPDYYHNLNPTDCPQRRGRDLSMLPRRF